MRFLILILIILSAACGKNTEQPAELVVSDVTASDELAGFKSPITSAAFWTHSSLAFNNLMIVGTEEMIASYNIEDGNRIDKIYDVSPTDLAVGYMGTGSSAKGVLVFFDNATSAFVLFTIDNIDRSFIPMVLTMPKPEQVNGFCLGRKTTQAGIALRVLTDTRIETYDLTLDGPTATATISAATTKTEPLVDCAIDDLDGALFGATGDGKIYRYTDDAEPTAPFAIAGADSVTEIGLSLSGLVEGGNTDACCGQIALLDSNTGHVHLFDRDDGHALGVAAISASFDVEGVVSATTMGLGYGNFGAAYRNGLLALATRDEKPVIRIAPWTGVLNALDQPIGEAANPRELLPQEEEDAFSIDLGAVNP